MLKLNTTLKFIRGLVDVSGLPDLEADKKGLKSLEVLSVFLGDALRCALCLQRDECWVRVVLDKYWYVVHGFHSGKISNPNQWVICKIMSTISMLPV